MRIVLSSTNSHNSLLIHKDGDEIELNIYKDMVEYNGESIIVNYYELKEALEMIGGRNE